MDKLRIPRKIYNDMIDYCYACLPYEACGILGGIGSDVKEIYIMTNVEKSNISYMMEPAEQFNVMKELRMSNLSLTAIFHSHPSSIPYPSSKDLALAFYEDTSYIIIGMLSEIPETKAFSIKNQKDIEEVEIFIED